MFEAAVNHAPDVPSNPATESKKNAIIRNKAKSGKKVGIVKERELGIVKERELTHVSNFGIRRLKLYNKTVPHFGPNNTKLY